MSWIWLNIPLAVVMVAFTVGLPLWTILKHAENDTSDASPTRALPREQASVSALDGDVSAKAARDRGRRAA